MKMVGDSAAASARFVRGPMAIRVIVSGGLSSSIRRISLWEGREDGSNKVVLNMCSV